jgi:non-ribosomal peptide synthetase-like protein
MDQAEQAFAGTSFDYDAGIEISSRVELCFPALEKVLTCPDCDNAIRWRPGERLDHLIEQRCAQLQRDGYGDHLAVTTNDADLSYAALNHKADQLARYLIRQGISPDDRVGLIFSKSVWTYIAMLAVAKVKAAYVPLDPGFPKDRVWFIAEDADIRLFLSTSNLRGQIVELPAPVIWLDEVQALIDKEEIDSEPGIFQTLIDDADPADRICYIIYTSGSTGKPKGVAVDHSSICNFIRSATEIYGLTQDDRVYQGMTIAFDFSVEEIWVPLYSGATLVPGPSGPNLVGTDLADFLDRKSITALCCVPTLLATIAADLPSLRFILASGEACPHNLIERWHKSGRTFLNVYGPTEATVTATWTLLHPHKPVTIGVPLPTYSIVILDTEENRLAQEGAAGEIGIAGIGLAREYVNRPDLTGKAFIHDFLDLANNPSQRIYRTGDLGRITESGEIEYLGRIDTQVKIRGYRIELAEIESVLMTVPGIAQAVVSTFEPTPGMVELVAYYTVRRDIAQVDPDSIFVTIRDQLPAYMLPSFFEPMAALPMMPSDKVDRKKLPAPVGPRFLAKRSHFAAPRNDIERELATILADFLRVEQVSVDDHFFNDLGANSLLMARFCATIRERLNFSDVSMREVYLRPSVREFASFLGTKTLREPPPVRDEPVHVATDAQYWVCGILQLMFLGLYSTALVMSTIEGYNWVSQTTEIKHVYLRSVAFGTGLFLALAFVPIALKWLLIGKGQAERFPIWSLRYVRFWVVRQLLQLNPMVMFIGTPLYNVYLSMLGAKIGRNAVIFSRVVPACPDLITIGDGAILRKDSILTGYRARSGFIETGPISIGRNAFVGETAVLDIGTSLGDGAQLGHASSLHQGQSVPTNKRYHGSPAQETQDNYNSIEPKICGTLRRVAFSVAQLTVLFAVNLPLPFVVMDTIFSWLGFGTGTELADGVYQNIADPAFHYGLLTFTIATFFGFILSGLLSVMILPRLLNLFLKPDKIYVLYGFHFLLFRTIFSVSNSYFLNRLFGDSSYILYYLKAIGYRLSLSDQTGSNFGVEQKHDTPFLCEIGKGTLVSDGLSMVNAQTSSSSFKLSKVSICGNSFLGNNIVFPSNATIGDNCLLGTKVMVPIDGPVIQDVGLLGSPCFEIPRSVVRDKQFEHYKNGPTFRERLFRKNVSNTITIAMFLMCQWFYVYIMSLSIALEVWRYSEVEWVVFIEFPIIAALITVLYFAFVDRASLGFSRLRPQFCSIYDDYYWKHERHWKLDETFYLRLFDGTPFKSLIWRLLGVKVGRKLFDDGSAIPEKTLVSIGDYCTINQQATLQSHSLEDGTFKSDYIHIGNGCTIGCNAFVHYGVQMNDNVVLDPDSFLMKGEILSSNSTWRGNPAKQI